MIAWLWAVWAWMASAGPSPSVQAVADCLDLQDVACAEAVVAAGGFATSSQGDERAAAARVAFYKGDYPAAYDGLQAAIAAGFVDSTEQLALYERTMFATAGQVEHSAGRFRIRHKPGVEQILVDGAADVLARTDRFVAPLIGPVPPGSTLVELFPDGRSFIAASSLTKDDVLSTGVVALSKWTRLLVTSPRARSTGYDWMTTLSHEYIHLIVAHATADRAPVWLQEGIAKLLDGRWRTGTTNEPLDATPRRWLAEALSEDALVPFDEMHPSLAKIKVYDENGEIDREASSRRASVAYSQLQLLMAWTMAEAGDGAVRGILERVRAGEDAQDALAAVVGAPSFAEALVRWEAWLRAQPDMVRELALVAQGEKGASAAPTVLDGGSDAEADPVLARRRDLANFTRLGELLARRGRHRAALIEYDKAVAAEEELSPVLSNRRAASMIALDQLDQARAVLDPVAMSYPEFALTWQQLAVLDRRAGQTGRSIEHLRRALELSPFHQPTRETLQQLLVETGDTEGAQREAAILRVLQRGGDDVVRLPIHERSGAFELPRSEPQAGAAGGAPAGPPIGQHRLEGEPAPDFTADKVGGGKVTLSGMRGKVVMLDFWATWCGPCRATMPGLSSMADRLASKGLVVVGLSDELSSVVDRFLAGERAQGRSYKQQLALESGGVRRSYRVSSLPTLVLVDRRGVVRKVHVGAGDLAVLETEVEALLAE
jgi:thiol-disulfide isomerase/thioredoxin/tetratricopeptide (TPR) repeat protein